ncbi:L-histidine N(alpha)-methyltransferase [Noviherbaspirillum cavernae]|uniref:L-histidine N(Alpha)-methyltransferase n=1 Tax=Noviherbaspirillum cavernae TaxID=2320862 RepID=A0A418X686_9BURK|nr:L-histidine N(alpha)-methyltransferase [Noviherbaspirillum cavernae]
MRNELSAGLLAEIPFASSKYLYDVLGSKLFEAICELPEYYPTRTEAAIFSRHLPDIARSVEPGSILIDLGAGNCAKAARMFSFLHPSEYVAIDISVDFLQESVTCLQSRFPQIKMTGVGMDFSSALSLPAEIGHDRRLFFYPGSSIGNYTPEQATVFLARIREACRNDGGLLIGVDLVKDTHVLNAAYDDALGLTGAFNLNLLVHLNNLLGANFDPREWRHRAFFNERKSRIEMHLEARRDIDVKWSQGHRHFREGQRIHTENSYKYTQDSFRQLLARAGFADARTWTDERGWFMVCHARAV